MVRPEALRALPMRLSLTALSGTALRQAMAWPKRRSPFHSLKLATRCMVDEVDMRHYTRSGIAQPASARDLRPINKPRLCSYAARPMPGHDIEVRNEDGERCRRTRCRPHFHQRAQA